jgi:hypothetical protein
MNEDDKARPVSGEIMAHGAPSRARARENAFTDAEYEPVAAVGDAASQSFRTSRPTSGMDFLKERKQARSGSDRSGGPLFWVAGLALVVLAFWISGGHDLVRNTVLVAVEGKDPPLRINDVTSRIERHDGRDILFVEGHAENGGTQRAALPGIEITVFANDGRNTRYLLGTKDTELGPGDRYAFSSRLEAPTYGVKTVSVTFQEGNR